MLRWRIGQSRDVASLVNRTHDAQVVGFVFGQWLVAVVADHAASRSEKVTVGALN
jgi:hypothetical protein